MPAEKPLTIECARCYSTAIVPILSFGRGPRGDDTVGCAACGYTWRATEDVTAAVVEAEQAWVESQAATEDDTPLHLLRDGTTGTTLEALHEAHQESEAKDARIAALEAEVARKNATLLEVSGHGAAADYGTSRVAVALGLDPECSLAKCAEVADALMKRRERDVETIQRLRAVADDRLARTDAAERERDAAVRGSESLEHRRALRLRLVRQRAQLRALGSEHAKLTWRRARLATERVATLTTALADALDALSLMTGFVEAQFYAEKYGVPETMARLKLLLPSEDSVATVKEPAP